MTCFPHPHTLPQAVRQLSALPCVSRVVSLGTVLALELDMRRYPGTGDTSAGASATTTTTTPCSGYEVDVGELFTRLLHRGIYTRPLGNVIYVMASLNSPAARCDEILAHLRDMLGSPGHPC